MAAAQPSAEAKQALDGFNSRFPKSQATSHYFQTIDPNQVHLTRLTLSSMVPLRVRSSSNNSGRGGTGIGGEAKEEEGIYLSNEEIKRSGIPTKSRLIPSEHLMFFTPRVSNASLGKDGSDTSFNPPGGVFTRRMWAGGEMTFERDNHLQVGDKAWERTVVEEEATHKVIKSTGSEMIVVWVKKEIGNERGLCLTDRRSWIFQPKLDSKDSSAAAASVQVDAVPVQGSDSTKSSGNRTPPAPLDPSTSTRLVQDAASLFRYSALTFNAHAIHLSPPWARQVEGHPDIVVHGPLNLSLLLRKWGREVGGWSIDEKGHFFTPSPSGDEKAATATPPPQLHKVTYRAKKPLHAGIPYWIGLSSQDPNKVLAVKETDGQVAMEATITTW